MLRNPFRDLDHKKMSRSSDALKTQNDYFKIVNQRIVIFIGVIVCVFAVIAVRLFIIQIRDNESWATKLENYSSQSQREMPPRGQIYDRTGTLVAKTVAAHNVVYFPPKDVTTTQQWELAKKFIERFSVSTDKMTESDYKDLYQFLHVNENGISDSGKSLLTQEELEKVNRGEATLDTMIREKITQEMIDEVADEKTKQAYVVYQRMNKLPSNQSKTIIEDVSDEDAQYLMVHKDEYLGFSIDLNSSKREYPFESTFRDVLGSVTTSQQGLPSELSDYYTSLGYALTDRVGKSGLELQYESLLSGTAKVSSISYDSDGLAVFTETTSGKKGYDLHLSVDIDLQQKVDEILANILKEKGGTKDRENFKNAFVTLMNPQTGEIYAMSGASLQEDGSIINYASGNYLYTYQVGSVVKGATVYMMLAEGIQTRDSVEYDAPMSIAGTKTISSFHNYGNVNAVRALDVSSNIYMFKSVIKLGGGEYQENQPLNITDPDATLNTMRQYYSMFGMGIKTGLDVPNESLGIMNPLNEVGNLLSFSIGQFDTYTPIQLAQYASTIANGGKKVQPKLVNSATEVNSDYIVFENKTKILATLSSNEDNLNTVRDGFKACVTSTNCGLISQGSKYDVAAKTGTAENGETSNASLVGFAPYSGTANLAFACSAPESSINTGDVAANVCAYDIMPQVLDEFYKKY